MPKALTIEVVTGNVVKYAGGDADEIAQRLALARRGAGDLVELPKNEENEVAVLVVDHVAMWTVQEVAKVPDDFFDYVNQRRR